MNALAAAGLFLLAGVALAPAATAAEESGRTSSSLARETAERNAKTPAGKRYEGVLVPRAEDWLRPVVERCVKDAPTEERISFDVFVRVGVGGKAEEVVLAPRTAVARCVAPEFVSAKYPSPPQPSWWVKIEVRLK